MPCEVLISPYLSLIERYFPTDQQGKANCISLAECCPTEAGYPSCVIPAGAAINCGQGVVQNPQKWGIFGILDACWSPAYNPTSPFMAAQWEQVLDPAMNTWMASVIYSYQGWAAWTTCAMCEGACEIGPPPAGTRYPIPYPDSPEQPVQANPFPTVLVAAAGAAAASVLIMSIAARRR